MYQSKRTNKAVMVLWAVLGLLVGFYIGFSAFVWGFSHGAFSEPLELKQTSGIEQQAWTVPLQAYNDSVYYLQPTQSPYNSTLGTKPTNDTLTINKSIIDLIKESYSKEPLPRFLQELQ